MHHISELLSAEKYKEKPWLIVGKGPSFAEINKVDLDKFFIFCLNHTISAVERAEIIHAIDFDVFTSCASEIYSKAKYLVMPINPHFNNKPTEDTLFDLLEKNAVLKKLSEEGRLFWYNHIKGKALLSDRNKIRLNYKDVVVKYFSAEVPFYMLGMFGIKELYSVGIDGGNSYDGKFSNSTLLANGRPSFDVQFDCIRDSIEKFDITYSPINSQYPIKIYVGFANEQTLAVKVLEYSIKKRTKVDIEVVPMPVSGVIDKFLVPQLNGFSGRAIYMDYDVLVLKDIRQIWNLPMSNSDIFTLKNSLKGFDLSVMLFNCDRLKSSINAIKEVLGKQELGYKNLLKKVAGINTIAAKIPNLWSCSQKDNIALIKYDDLATQPWISVKHPFCSIWVSELIEAIDNNFINIEMVRDSVAKGLVRPSLLYQVENRVVESGVISEQIKSLDKNFVNLLLKNKPSLRKKIIQKIRKLLVLD